MVTAKVCLIAWIVSTMLGMGLQLRVREVLEPLRNATLVTRAIIAKYVLALLWQIHSRRCSLQIHFRQCGHRRGGSRAMSSRMAWRTAGKVGWGGGPLILFFPPCCCEAAMLEEGVGDHRHERMTV